jgi:hypothetical protein
MTSKSQLWVLSNLHGVISLRPTFTKSKMMSRKKLKPPVLYSIISLFSGMVVCLPPLTTNLIEKMGNKIRNHRS